MKVPKIWNHISVPNDGGNYLYGISIDSVNQSYDFIITDLSTKFWIESVDNTRLLIKLDDNGIDIISKDKTVDFLNLLQRLVDSGSNATLNSKVPSQFVMKLSNAKLDWTFKLSVREDDELDKLMKFQMFNSISIQANINDELQRVIRVKDRIIQTLLENFLELNNSYNSSLDENEADFQTKVENNKSLNKLFPDTMKKSLLKFNYQSMVDEIPKDENIWKLIKNSINEREVWGLSDRYTVNDTRQARPIQNQRVKNSDFINFDDLPAKEDSIMRSLSPKRRKLTTDHEFSTRDVKTEQKTNPTPSPSHKKFGVIGEMTPSRKRKLKAGTSSPIKAPRLI